MNLVEKNQYGTGWVGHRGTVRVEGKTKEETKRALEAAVEERLTADTRVERWVSDYAGPGARIVQVRWDVMFDHPVIEKIDTSTGETVTDIGRWKTVQDAILQAEINYPRRV